MCGGMRRKHEMSWLTRTVLPGEEIIPTGNIIPMDMVRCGGPVASVVNHRGVYRMLPMIWGLRPAACPDLKLINARAESLTQKPSFRDLIGKFRCLVAADSCFEWKDGERIEISLPEEKPLVFAGLFTAWRKPGGAIDRTCAVITTEPTAWFSKIHDRMPVILPLDNAKIWIGNDPAAALRVLRPYSGELIAA
jgi:putative SOS response-associated peptidase YedK